MRKLKVLDCFCGFLIPMENRMPMGKMNGRLRSWDRAKIPKCVSSALACALLQE